MGKNSSLLLALFMLTYTCSKEESINDSEEIIIDKEEVTIDNKKTTAKATADWKKFNATSEKLLAFTVSNLKSLSALRKKPWILMNKTACFFYTDKVKINTMNLKIACLKKISPLKKTLTTIINKPNLNIEYLKISFLPIFWS